MRKLPAHLDDLDLETIEILIGVTRSDRQKNEFAGPECNLILSKLDTLRDLLPENLHIFVDALKQVKEIYRIAHATTVEVDHREKIELFRNTWLTLMQDFGQTMPLKVHIILDHLSDYFEMEGKTLRNTNDQFIEACHAKGSPPNFFLGKLGILSQRGGGVSPIPTFYQNCPKLNLPWNCP